MGTSNFESNVQGKDGTQTLTNFATISATNISGTTLTGNTSIVATSYLKLGTNQYIFFGALGKGASIVAAATALVATPIKGSLYLSTRGEVWCITTDTAASPIELLYSNP